MASMDIDGIYKKLTGDDMSNASEIPVSSDIDKEISLLITKNTISSENDITEYAKYLSLKYGGSNKSVENELMENIFIRVILLKMKKEKPA